MTLYIAPIVEGETEDTCVERLLQRTWSEILSAQDRLQVLEPARSTRGLLLHATGLGLAAKIDEAHLKLVPKLRRDPSGRGLLLILLDSEGTCPKELGPRLLAVAKSHRRDLDITCVLAHWMFENWIVAGASTLGGVNGLPDPLLPPAQCEERSGSKWLGEQLRHQKSNRAYKKTVDAKVFIQRMNLQECRDNAPSFDKLCRDLAARLPPPPDDAPAPEA